MSNEITEKKIEAKILTIRNQQVMIDRDLAELYGTETKVLNQAVKRNIERFPEDFMFQLDEEEFDDLKSQFLPSEADNANLKSQIVTSSWGGTRKLPYAFTEQGVAMLSSVLKSPTAVEVNIQIMRAFVAMRHFFQNNAQAKQEIILIDNYVDLSILQRLAKKKKNVNVVIYTDPKTKLTTQDIQKFNTQYPTISLNHTTKMHDRFLIIDQKTLYHVGASLKDLGKKCFAFEVLDSSLIAHLLKNM
ncbi:MAG: ORF6N domain-containing protein [Treponema sp.]|nr:ORF6N domain-containing protein [Treponema sp.]